MEIMGVVETLRNLDDVYGKMEQELRDKIAELQKEYQPKLDAILKDRTTELSKTHAASKDAKATPAIPRFWLDVLLASDEFGEIIQEYDEPLLEYLDSIETSNLDPTDEDKGFIVTFKFNPNPFFKNTEIRKVYTLVRSNEFTDQLEITRIESDEIEWNEGKNVTVEIVTKKKSGGGARKKKSAAKEEPRPSFFRFFRTIDEDNLPSELGDYEEEEDEDEMGDQTMDHLQMIMQDDWESAVALKDLIIPRAIRWYTGEAVDVMEGSDEDDDEDDDDDDDDYEDEDDEDEEESPKNLFPGNKKAGAQNPEECKQQ